VLTAAVVAALTVSACAGRANRPRLAYEERPVEALYNTGYQRLQSRRWNDAIDYFQEVERQHPYSEWSRRAILMQIYAYYQGNDYQESIAAADRFIALFPGNPSAPYAFYMKALCNFEQITDVGRDQGYAQQALDGLRDVARPASRRAEPLQDGDRQSGVPADVAHARGALSSGRGQPDARSEGRGHAQWFGAGLQLSGQSLVRGSVRPAFGRRREAGRGPDRRA
jgi:tetratricopeptide (TPR) repeat protein